MNPQEQLHNFFKSRISPLFPIAYLEKLRTLDTGFFLPGSVKIGTLIVPIIAIHVHPDGLDYFGIRKGPYRDMNHRLRYLDNQKKDEIVQICLHMKSNRQLALNLDPLSELTRRYLEQISETGLFGFVFFCEQWKLFLCSYTAPNEEEADWIKRNIKRARRLRKNDFERIMMDSILQDEMTGQTEKKYYIGEKGTVDECFFSPNAGSIPLERVNEYLY